jgi:hypothetical protein
LDDGERRAEKMKRRAVQWNCKSGDVGRMCGSFLCCAEGGSGPFGFDNDSVEKLASHLSLKSSISTFMESNPYKFLYIYPTIKIWGYGTAIRKLVDSRSADDLVKALDMQRAFWKFIGIMMIILFSIYFLMFVVMIVMGATGVLKNLPAPQ